MKKIITLFVLLIMFGLFVQSCENEDENIKTTSESSQLVNQSNGGNEKLIAIVKPAEGYEVKFWDFGGKTLAIESRYPVGATGELVDIIEAESSQLSALELYKKLADTRTNSEYVKNIMELEAKVNDDIANYEKLVESGKIIRPTSEFQEENKSKITSFSSSQDFNRDYVVDIKPATKKTKITVIMTVKKCFSVCPACPLVCLNLPSIKTLPSGTTALRMVFKGAASVEMVAKGSDEFQSFNMRTAADKNPALH